MSGPGMAWVIVARRAQMVEILKSFMISQGNWNRPDFDDVGVFGGKFQKSDAI